MGTRACIMAVYAIYLYLYYRVTQVLVSTVCFFARSSIVKVPSRIGKVKITKS